MEGKATSRNKARLLVLSIFAIGFAAGALSMNLYQSQKSSPPNHHGTRPTSVAIVDKMSDKLNLTRDQHDQVSAILKDTFNQYDIIRQEADPCFLQFRPRFDAVRQAGREKIRAVLTDEQRPKFEQMVAEQDAERERERENRNRKKAE